MIAFSYRFQSIPKIQIIINTKRIQIESDRSRKQNWLLLLNQKNMILTVNNTSTYYLENTSIQHVLTGIIVNLVLRFLRLRVCMSMPSMRMEPAALYILKIVWKNDDFPAPVRPTIPTFSPGFMFTETFFRTSGRLLS